MPSRGPKRRPELSAAVLFPNRRSVACASLGFLKAFDVLRKRVAVADLSYVPSGRDDPILSPKQGLLLGETTRFEVRRFDVIGFSVSYENDYAQVPGLLLRAGLDPMAADRERAFPLVISGGFTMSTNPLPLADFVDIVVVGEIEPLANAIVNRLEEARSEGLDKHQLLLTLSGIPGLYLPALGERPVRRIWSSLESIAPEPVSQPDSEFGDMFLVETGRGCGRGCNFCAAGSLYRPVRMRSGASVVALAGDAPRVGLVGTAVGDHPDLETMLEELTARNRRIGIASLRPDQITERLAALLVKGGVKTIAVAPEAGTEALRARIGKPLSDDDVSGAIEMLSAAGVSRVKLYFMIGLPGETDADVAAIVDQVARLRRLRGRTRLAVAAGPFVPKPHTAFQWAPFCDMHTLRRRVGMLRRISRMKGCSLKIQPIDEAWAEAVLSRGDRRLSAPILEAALESVPLKRVLRRTCVEDPTIELETEKPLPWDFIDSGVDKKRLKRTYLGSRPG